MIGQVGRYDDFLELGGDSLFVTQVAEALMERFGVKVSLEMRFEMSTISEQVPILKDS